MTNRFVLALVAALGAAGALLSVVAVPWAHYGDFRIPLSRFPAWFVIAIGMIVLYLSVGRSLLRGQAVSRMAVATATVSAACTIICSVVLMARYSDATALFSGPIPMVLPRLGLGGPIGVLAALLAVAVMFAVNRSSARQQVAPARD